MRLSIIPKSELSSEQVRWIDERLSAPEHREDLGPPRVWEIYRDGLFAVVDANSNQPIGLVEASGTKNCVSPGWWIDKEFRGKGYGSKLVDALAQYLKCQGFTGAGVLEIQTAGGEYDCASQNLAKRFQSYFNMPID
jgi:RimJ/RimL family protein N-acetyltransferase